MSSIPVQGPPVRGTLHSTFCLVQHCSTSFSDHGVFYGSRCVRSQECSVLGVVLYGGDVELAGMMTALVGFGHFRRTATQGLNCHQRTSIDITRSMCNRLEFLHGSSVPKVWTWEPLSAR